MMKYIFLILMFFSQLVPDVISDKLINSSTPNVIIFYMDDMGYGDLSCFGALGHMTPNIDKMANEGMKFTNFLAPQAVCSASRAGLMTGCYPNRIGMSGVLFPDSDRGIKSDEKTLAELFKESGYITQMIGKWHLGDKFEFMPIQKGFDDYFGLPYSNDMWPLDYHGKKNNVNAFQKKCPPLYIIEGNKKSIAINSMEEQEKITTLYTEHAVDFIKKNKNRHFFLYFAHNMPHVPLAVSDKFKGKSNGGIYGDVMMEIDWSVGEVLNTLKEEGLDENTIVIFTSDNGPWKNFGNHSGSTSGFREGKQTVFEGGQRVPMIIKWPKTVESGTVCNKLVSGIDIMPTLANLCHLSLPEYKIDGVNFSELLEDNDISPREEFYYYYDENSLKAVRKNNWKLVLPHHSNAYEMDIPGSEGFGGMTSRIFVPSALYDLRRDPGERFDLKDVYPEVVKELNAIAEQAREDLGDDLTDRVGKGRRL